MKRQRTQWAGYAHALWFAGALLWLVKMPTIELGILPAQPGQEASLAILTSTFPGVALIGLAAIAAGTAVYAAIAGSRLVVLATASMIAGLAMIALPAFVLLAPENMGAGFALYAAACAASALAMRSRLVASAAVALALYSVTVIPGGPFDGLFVMHDLAPAAFGVALMTFALRSGPRSGLQGLAVEPAIEPTRPADQIPSPA